MNATSIPKLPKYKSFYKKAQKELVSDRSLFQPVLDSFNGVIVHLSDYKVLPWRFCGHMLEYKKRRHNYYQFKKGAKEEVADLLYRMMKASPDDYVLYLTDYQGATQTPKQKYFANISAFLGSARSHLASPQHPLSYWFLSALPFLVLRYLGFLFVKKTNPIPSNPANNPKTFVEGSGTTETARLSRDQP